MVGVARHDADAHFRLASHHRRGARALGACRRDADTGPIQPNDAASRVGRHLDRLADRALCVAWRASHRARGGAFAHGAAGEARRSPVPCGGATRSGTFRSSRAGDPDHAGAEPPPLGAGAAGGPVGRYPLEDGAVPHQPVASLAIERLRGPVGHRPSRERVRVAVVQLLDAVGRRREAE